MKSNKENFDAIIIGSGIGGLVTASQLAAKGAKVLVLEKYIIPGGSGGSFKRKGYTFDVGASMIFGFGEKGYTNLLTRALKDVNEKCETIPDPVQLEYHLPNNLTISVDREYEVFISNRNVIMSNQKKNKFQPMPPSFGLVPELNKKINDKKLRYKAYQERSLAELKIFKNYLDSCFEKDQFLVQVN